MTIIIPSQNIYEINNQKVVDNEVDSVEVKAKNVVQDDRYSEPVYNENVETGFYENNENVEDTHHDLGALVVPTVNPRMLFYACSVFANAQYYLNKTIFIPFIIDNKHILNNILTGVDKNGNANISYSCSGTIINGRAAQSPITVLIEVEGWRITSSNSFFSHPLESEGDQYIIASEEEGSYNIPNEETNNYSDDTYNVQTKIEIERKDNLSTIKAEKTIIDGKEYLKLELKQILCGIRIIKANGNGTAYPTSYRWDTQLGTGTLQGNVYDNTYTQYIPKQVSITIYGNTIGIDLEDETVKLGDGQHVYSFDGNELMQTSNTPSIESDYTKVISSWANGKETVTLKCGISPYYGYNTNKTICHVTSYTEKGSLFGFRGTLRDKMPNTEAIISATIKVSDQKTYEIQNIEITDGGTVLRGDVPYDVSQPLGYANYEVNYHYKDFCIDPTSTTLPMTIHIGDEIIPYVMGADGNDKPMSLYVDKTPKEFTVIGKGIIADGEIMQEITAQEKTYTRIKIVSIEEGDLEFEVLTGKISPYDLIEYNGQTFLVKGTAQSAQGEKRYLVSAYAETWQGLSVGETITTSVKGRDEPKYPTVEIQVISSRGSAGSYSVYIEIKRITSGEFEIGHTIEYQAESATIMEAIPSEEGGESYILLCKDGGVFYGSIGKNITVKEKPNT